MDLIKCPKLQLKSKLTSCKDESTDGSHGYCNKDRIVLINNSKVPHTVNRPDGQRPDCHSYKLKLISLQEQIIINIFNSSLIKVIIPT